MPIKNWSTTPSANTSLPPNGAPESNTKLKDYNDIIRQMMADIRNLAAEGTIASAATCDIGGNDATFLTITGTTTITSLGTVAAGIYKFVVFSGALTLTHNATSLILRTGANRTTAAGDVAMFKSEGSGNWREMFYHGGSDYQPLDATLTALAALNSTAGLLEQTGADAFTKRTIGTASGNIPAVGTVSATEALAGLSRRATTVEAQAGTEDTAYMTALKTAQAISALTSNPVKAWVYFSGAGTLLAGYNIDSVVRNGTGDYTVTFSAPLASANYSAACIGDASGASFDTFGVAAIRSALAGSCRIMTGSVGTGSGIPSDRGMRIVFVGG